MSYEEDYEKFQITSDLLNKFNQMSNGYEIQQCQPLVSIKCIKLEPCTIKKNSKEKENA